MRLDGKVAIVTGSATGIGQAIAVGLAEAGVDIAGVYRSSLPDETKDLVLSEWEDKIREDLNNELAEFGIEKLQEELQEVDPKYFEEVDIFNKQRVTRALEIFRASGLPFSHFRNQDLNKRPFNIIKIGLELPREEMYDRINHRVDIMMNEGLLNEAKNLFSLKDLNALQTVGYRELFDFFEEKITLDFAIEEIKKNTRRFAKRQMTWFKKDETVNWFSPFDQENIINFISNKI